MAIKKPSPALPLFVGAISPDFLYTTEEIFGRLAWTTEDATLACSKGLKTYVFCNNVYVLGSDVIEFIKTHHEGKDA